ncbi:Crp/Fnr family transcriptional regulator [Puteibacter caeruleilacunae]|nr:Crp/Fnr family transcriptional regulator [Puteibacter caeruleilacunae]
MKRLIEYIARFTEVNPALEQEILKRFEYESYKRHEHILEVGRTCRKLYFVNSGTIRTYYLKEDREITSWIYPENDFVTLWSSFLMRTPSVEYIQAISKVEVFSISYDKLQELYALSPQMESFGRQLMEMQIAFLDEISREFSFATAQFKYERLLELFPDIIQIASLGHIASILGISQETLSRIRKNK